MRVMTTCMLFAWTVGVAACDDGRAASSDDGGAADRGSAGLDSTAPVPDLGPEGDRCVVAIRVDDCCVAAQPVRLRAVVADPCLVLWPPRYPVDAACLAKRDPSCAQTGCNQAPPPSRRAAEVGRGCAFVDECVTDADCALALDARRCCFCPEAYPAELVPIDPCLLSPEQSSLPEECRPDCSGIACERCLDPQGVTCASGNGFSVCQTLWPD